MASTNMCVRSMSYIARISRSALFKQTHQRSVRHLSTTTNEQNKVKPPPTDDGKVPPAVEATKAEETGPSEIELTLTKENEKLSVDLKELKDKYMRSLAETENVRTRMRKQVDEAKVFGIQGFCKDLLEVADILNQATDSTPQEEVEKNPHLKALFEGLTLTNSQLLKVFKKHGLNKIDPVVGDKFDPFFHEALFEVPLQGEGEAGTIAVIQKTGYQLQERTLRPALVGVFKTS